MESQYLMDSNVVIDYLMGRLPTSGMEFMNHVIDNESNCLMQLSLLLL